MKNLSIIVVSLNSKNDFIKTIKSVVNQTYKKKEIIIVDGLSSDGTIEQIQKFKKYFSKIVIEKDKGIYDAMNKGINFSSGKWTMFLNSGDTFYKKDTLDKIFKQKLLDNDILFGDTLINNKGIKYLVKAKNFTINTIIMPFCHQSTIVKTKILKNLMFSLKYRYSSDFHFFFKCYNKKKKFLNLNLIISKVISDGISDKNRQKVFSENISVLRVMFNSTFAVRLWRLKFFEFIKNSLKFILPKFIIAKILTIKYKSILYS